jgi:phosphoserine phosphatase RsbU/P
MKTEAADSRLTPEEKLHDIQAITDAELSRLDADQLLMKLLDRLKEIMQADTAAVLLLDRSGGPRFCRARRHRTPAGDPRSC